MVAPLIPPIKQKTEVNLPILSDKTHTSPHPHTPKKEPVTPKVLAIKLPLDIDITLQHDYNCVLVLFLFGLVLLFSLPLFFILSYHSQLQVYENELADLRIKVSELVVSVSQLSFASESISAASQGFESTISEIQSLVERCNDKRTKGKRIRRQKRGIEAGQSGTVKAGNEVDDVTQDNASNDTIRGNVKLQRRLLNHDRKGYGFGAIRAAHFKGLLPEKVVEAGQIGPWYEDEQSVGDFGLRTCNLRDRGVKLIVNETGLYLIYAQVYYLTSKSLNSFSININPGNKSPSIPVAFCSANASVNDQGASEVSCYTSVVRRLQAGDAISLQQQERQRRLVMREGHSFIGLVRLS